MQSVQGKNLKAFEPGKVYVLEFWATWCGPCISAFPHLNELARQFTPRGVEFYSITAEAPDVVTDFIKKRELATNVLCDTTRKTVDAYGITVIPRTAIIDQKGVLRAITAPEEVTAESLQKLLDNKPVSWTTHYNKVAAFDWDEDIAKVSKSLSILQESDSNSGGSKFPPNSGRITADGHTVLNMIMIGLNTDYYTTEIRLPENTVSYRYSIKAPDGSDETARKMLLDLARSIVDFKVSKKQVEKEVYVLTKSGPLNLPPSKGPNLNGMANGGGIRWPDCDMKTLAGLAKSFMFGAIVVDETGDTGRYEIDWKWTPGSRSAATEVLEKAGLKVTKAKRMVEMTVVEPA